MSNNKSKYNSTKNPKVTYYLGAGASYNALPIWEKQGNSMIEVSNQITSVINNSKLQDDSKYAILFQNETLKKFATQLQEFGSLAVEYGSIDIYARRLHLLNEKEKLKNLKYCLSVYFDLWEKYFYKGQKINNTSFYQKIDKRYYSLLSILLDENGKFPKLNESISIITWNYDLQFEMAYASFLPNKFNSLETINSGLKFKDDLYSNNRLDIVHMNGYRGEFKSGDNTYPIVEDKHSDKIEDYLYGLLDNYDQFRVSNKPDYSDCIKYAWERNSKTIERAIKIMAETDILVIIGYSFPSFNRQIDDQLIKEFEKKPYSKVIYQDPNINIDVVNSLFRNSEDVELKTDINARQFYIPPEFLIQSEAPKISFGL